MLSFLNFQCRIGLPLGPPHNTINMMLGNPNSRIFPSLCPSDFDLLLGSFRTLIVFLDSPQPSVLLVLFFLSSALRFFIG